MAKPFEILLYRDIYSGDAAEMVAQIAKAGDSPIHLRVNSPGGSVFEGNAIYNALKAHKPGVTVTVDGIAASMASVIMLAGQKVRVAKNAMIMIHNPGSCAFGGAEEMRKEADLLDTIKAGLLDIYCAKIGDKATREEVSQMLDDETWLTAEAAVAMGLADEVIEPEKTVDARFNYAGFKRPPFDKLRAIMSAAQISPEAFAALEKRLKAQEDAPKAAVTDESFAALEARVKVLEDTVAKLKPAENPEPTEATAKLKKEVTELTAKVTGHDSAIAAKDAEIKALKDSAETVLAKAKVLAPRMATEIAASFGLTKAIEKPKPDPKDKDIAAEYAAITDPAARSEFFRKNKAALIAANRAAKTSLK